VTSVAGASDTKQQAERAIKGGKAKNVILLIGDGMGDSEIALPRDYTVGANGRLNMDKFPLTGAYTTYAVHADGTPDYVTDSAASGTGWATGVKTVKWPHLQDTGHRQGRPDDPGAGAEERLRDRYLSGFAVDPKNADHVYLAVNGFSRHWTEGPGAGVGHVFESTDGGTTWKDISKNLPDVPTDSAVVTPNGGLAVATDLGVVYRAPGRTTWKRVGNLPAVAVLQLKLSPDGRTLYAATHGRGIYTIGVRDLR